MEAKNELARQIADEVCGVFSLHTSPATRPELPPLSRMQQKVMDALLDYRADHNVSPTLGELAAVFGISKRTVLEHLWSLEEKGWVKRHRYQSRGIEVMGGQSRRSTERLRILARQYAAAV